MNDVKPELKKLVSHLSQVHGYVSLVVCIFGSVANTLNIAVLTRREMTSPTNALLTGLAVADLLVMLEYIPFACHMYMQPSTPVPLTDRYSYPWSVFVLFHANFAQVCHTVSIWLTVTLAVWRYIAVAHPQRNREWCCMRTTIAAIISAYIVCPILCIPSFLAFSVQPTIARVDKDGHKIKFKDNVEGARNVTLYVLNISELGKANNDLLRQINFWIYSIVIKLIPCFALTELSRRLICALLETKKRRQQLTAASGSGKASTRNSRVLDKERQTDRTTRMLLAVLLLFLLTEFPQGILGLLSVWLGDKFFEHCYQKLGEVMDILALINSAINFILYCAMSRQFRSTFSILFRPSVLDRWLLVPQHNGNGDNNGCTTANNMTQVTQV
ncbi:hypothetical protein ANN_17198 [Periplaneta americana]|uniref:G-protein coupled receptors family 1 profile domain-containing protein n=1 Tax=Periplaneta americana TaxID=6978 RepID=A0ABQ8SSV4_PERAM|nr:hypothetical protein ANN_17198 [Periplaneta americana]